MMAPPPAPIAVPESARCWVCVISPQPANGSAATTAARTSLLIARSVSGLALADTDMFPPGR
jgi:hypothetical protein